MTWERRRDSVWEQDAGTVFAVAATVGDVLILDGIAALIWELLDGASTNEIIDQVADATGAPRDDIAPHVSEFLQELTSRALVMQR